MMLMLSLPVRAFCLGSLLSTAQAWGGGDDKKPFEAADEGEIVFVSSSGELESDRAFTFDSQTRAVKMDTFAAESFTGDSLNFRGREIRSAHLVDSSIEGLQHLTVETLALRLPDHTDKSGQGIAIVGGDGVVDTTRQMRWDDEAGELKLSGLSSFSKAGLAIGCDVDLNSHVLRNANIAANTTLSKLIFRDGRIENSVLHNVTATGLNLGDVALDSLSVSSFDYSPAVGWLVVVGEGGSIELSSTVKQEKNGPLLIDSEVSLTKSLDMNGQDVLNANIKSGRIEGNIDVAVDFMRAKGLTLTEIEEDKTVTSDGLAVLGLGGELTLGPISIDKSGSLGDIKMHGTIDFSRSEASGDAAKLESRGGIYGANIFGGAVDGLEKLSVVGEAELGAGLQVVGDTYLDGSLTVSGSVLGSGPYVDVSDRRFKKNVERMDSSEALEKILQLEGVSYELDFSHANGRRRLGRGSANKNDQGRQFGFIAQDVEELFPELVSTDEEDFRGLQYSRFAPVLVESIKQLAAEVRALREENAAIKSALQSIEQRLSSQP